MSILNVGIGFAFQALLAAELGLSPLADNFQLAWTILTFGAVLIASMVSSLLVPRIRDDITGIVGIGDAKKLLILGLLFAVAQLCLALSVASPDLRKILVWSALCVPLSALCAVPQTIAFLERRFILASLGPVINGIGLLSASLLFPSLGPASLGVALTVGYALQLIAVTLPLLRSNHPLSTEARVSIAGFTGVVAFTLVSKSQPLLERTLSSQFSDGVTAGLGFGQKIAQGLLMFAAFGLFLSVAPILSTHVKNGEHKLAGAVLARGLAGTILTSSVVVAFSVPLTTVATDLLFTRGNFSSNDATYVSEILLAQLPWVFACALSGVVTSYLYICGKYAQVLFASFAGLAATLIATLLLAQSTPRYAVAIASSVGACATLVWLSRLLVNSDVWPFLRTGLCESKLIIGAAIGLIAISFGSQIVLNLLWPDNAADWRALTLFLMFTYILISALSRPLRREIGAVMNASV